MSEENVKVVRKTIEAWNAGDMEAVRDLWDPDGIMRAPPGWPEPGPFVGREAVIRQLERGREAFDSDFAEFLTNFATVGDRVIVRSAWRLSGHGPEGNIEWTLVYTIRNGLVFQLEYVWDHQEALEAAGLSE
jgi:ketosteroid isomerase-like protein